MSADTISTLENIHELRASLAEHYGRPEYLRCESMGELLRENLESIRRNVAAMLPGKPQRLDGDAET